MIDRFWLLPEPTKILFRITERKLKAHAMGVRKIEAGPQGGRILFDKEPIVDPTTILRLIQTQPKTYKQDGQDKLRITMNLEDREARFQAVEKLLNILAPSNPA